MEDAKIIQLFFDRDEAAIARTDEKYGKYCRTIAGNILHSAEDSEECINDTYLQSWNSIPPQKPQNLRTYLGKICRNLAINLFEHLSAAKRGGGETAVCLDELAEVLAGSDVEEEIDSSLLTEAINCFLAETPKETRIIFTKRYFYMISVKDISKELGVTESKVKMTLLRTRQKLQNYLLKEGFGV